MTKTEIREIEDIYDELKRNYELYIEEIDEYRKEVIMSDTYPKYNDGDVYCTPNEGKSYCLEVNLDDDKDEVIEAMIKFLME